MHGNTNIKFFIFTLEVATVERYVVIKFIIITGI